MRTLTSRRSFLGGLIAAPAVVAVANIMPVRAIERLAFKRFVAPQHFYVDPSMVAPRLDTFHTIQEAIDACGVTGNSIVQLKSGIYTHDGAVLVPANVGLLVTDGDTAVINHGLTFQGGKRELYCIEAGVNACFHAKEKVVFPWARAA